jgi:solute carrier family 13 (sodium-dependent dicarboxylate transporter), member 2/3/5
MDRANTRRIAPRIGSVLAPIILIVLWFAPTHHNATARHAIAIAAMTIALWATEAIDHGWAGLIGMFLFWALGVSQFKVAFSGFWNDTPWFLFGALLIGAMASKSRLAHRIAYTIGSRIGASYSRLLLAVILVDFVLTFVMPSGVARVTVLAALVVGLVQALGLAPHSNVGRGLLITVTYTATIFDKMIMAGSVSILARGIIQQVTQIRVSYGQWFVAFLPAAVFTILCCWWIVPWLFPPERETLHEGVEYLRSELAKLGPVSRSEKSCAVLMTAAVALWMTDFAHHLSPSTVALVVGLLAFTPTLGVLTISDLRTVNVSVICFQAAALGMSRVLADSKGLEVLTTALLSWMTPLVTSPLITAAVLYWTACLYHIFLGSETAMLSTSLPAVLTFAKAHALHVVPVGMIWTLASGGKIFAYQGAVLLVGYAYGAFDSMDVLKFGAIFTVVEFAALLGLVWLYWPSIGILLQP